MLTIKPLASCTFEEAVRLWNEGFSDYFFPAHMTLDTYVRRISSKGLSPEHSVVAYIKGQPAGFILNGIRNSNRGKIAWNGGTAVLPGFRRLGVAKEMVQASLDLYRELGVEVATLEAISENEKAIQLYKSLGYKVVDRLSMYHQGDTEHGKSASSDEDKQRYEITYGLPSDAVGLPIYNSSVPWQTQWQSLRDGGEALIVTDFLGQIAGYALYKRTMDEFGKLSGITLYQCEINKNRQNREEIAPYILSKVFSSGTVSCKKAVVNLALSNEPVVKTLEGMGFTRGAQQVWMVCNI